jgi:4-hydroxy-tetrahydrodipicolinate reductase
MEMIRNASESIAVFKSANMSVGVALVAKVVNEIAAKFGNCDVEIVETHHNRKVDAPSGTALMIAEALSEERENTEYVYDRHSVRRARETSEIGIHSVRGGTIVGEHEVIFAGNNELLTLKHEATSREIFACGALKAAQFIAKKAPALYSMSDLINQ